MKINMSLLSFPLVFGLGTFLTKNFKHSNKPELFIFTAIQDLMLYSVEESIR